MKSFEKMSNKRRTISREEWVLYFAVTDGDLPLLKKYDSQYIFDVELLHEAILRACEKGHIEIIEYLRKMTNAPAIEHYRYKVLRSSCYYCQYKVTEYLLESTKFSQDVLNDALCMSCKRGHPQAVKLLLSHGAQIYSDGHDAVETLARYNNPGCLRVLVEHKADIFRKDTQSLRTAVACGVLDTIECLIELGADARKIFPTLTFPQGDFTRKMILSILVLNGADILSYPDFAGETYASLQRRFPNYNEKRADMLLFYVHEGLRKYEKDTANEFLDMKPILYHILQFCT
jgi:hypothetical protein